MLIKKDSSFLRLSIFLSEEYCKFSVYSAREENIRILNFWREASERLSSVPWAIEIGIPKVSLMGRQVPLIAVADTT